MFFKTTSSLVILTLTYHHLRLASCLRRWSWADAVLYTSNRCYWSVRGPPETKKSCCHNLRTNLYNPTCTQLHMSLQSSLWWLLTRWCSCMPRVINAVFTGCSILHPCIKTYVHSCYRPLVPKITALWHHQQCTPLCWKPTGNFSHLHFQVASQLETIAFTLVWEKVLFLSGWNICP